MDEKEKKELYDKICLAITWYEHPEEYPFGRANFNKHISEEFYKLLVEVQNKMFQN